MRCDKCGKEMVFTKTSFMETQIYECSCGRKFERPYAGKGVYY